MNIKKLTAAVATTALVASVPLAMLYPGAAVAVGHHSARPAVEGSVGSGGALTANLCSKPPTAQPKSAEAITNTERAAATSRLSGLAFGGAALDPPPTAQPESAQAIVSAERAARAAATSRLSGLPFGGAALDL